VTTLAVIDAVAPIAKPVDLAVEPPKKGSRPTHA
jgi:hypothetical protein